MQPFSILMFCFSGAILLYAGLLALTKDYQLIPRGHATDPKDKRAYAAAFARVMAVVALAPLSGGIYGLFNVTLGFVALLVSFPVCIWIGVRLFHRS